jgi:antitoxin (DNA-binding transcriptional repressor) of toxin-antitoxin stability system
MNSLSMRDLQKISGEAIGALPGTTAITSGGRTVALLTPIKRTDIDALAAVLADAEALARGRDAKADDEALEAFGEVDPVDWSAQAVRDLQTSGR